jgi:hypothetical protein
MEVVGKIKMIDTTKEVGTSGFKKRDVVVTTDEKYPQDILVQFVQDGCDLLNGFKVGESVTIGINLKGREWMNPKAELVYFNTIQGWNIKKDTNGINATKVPNASEFELAGNAGVTIEDDGLPF